MKRLQNLFSFDRILLSTTGLGCGVIFYQAHQEGQQPLQGQRPASNCRFDSHQRVEFTQEICTRLEKEGYIVVDNFLNLNEVRDAISCTASLDFRQNPNERDGDLVRTDRISFFERSENVCDMGMNTIKNSFHRLIYDVSCSAFNGFDKNDNYSNSWLGVPSTMQISLYDILDSNELKREGSFYLSHVDACSNSFLDLGVLGWLRSKYLRRRYLTCIVYLNPEWKTEDGGCLRIFHKDGTHVDVEPQGGKLVIFSSAKITHAVLPTFSKRLACTVWVTLNQ